MLLITKFIPDIFKTQFLLNSNSNNLSFSLIDTTLFKLINEDFQFLISLDLFSFVFIDFKDCNTLFQFSGFTQSFCPS